MHSTFQPILTLLNKHAHTHTLLEPGRESQGFVLVHWCAPSPAYLYDVIYTPGTEPWLATNIATWRTLNLRNNVIESFPGRHLRHSSSWHKEVTVKLNRIISTQTYCSSYLVNNGVIVKCGVIKRCADNYIWLPLLPSWPSPLFWLITLTVSISLYLGSDIEPYKPTVYVFVCDGQVGGVTVCVFK